MNVERDVFKMLKLNEVYKISTIFKIYCCRKCKGDVSITLLNHKKFAKNNYWSACAPSHKMGFRSSVSKSGLPGERRHEGLVPRNDVFTNGFI